MKRETATVRRALVLLAAVLPACSDALDQDTTAGQVVVVLNQGSGDVSLVDVTRFATSSFSLAPGVPTSVDARGLDLVVALGDSDAVQVATANGPTLVTRLAEGAGATGVAIDNDSIAWVANPNVNAVTRFNYRSGDTTTYAAGSYPQAVVVTEGFVFFVNGNLVGGQPAGPSSLRWLTRSEGIRAFGTVALTCTNARFATLGADGFLYVVCSGTAGAADGRLAIVDPVDRKEVAVINGLGESPGPAVYHPSGRLLIASPTEGILEVSAGTRSLVRGPGEGIKPAGDGVQALVVDTRGRLYAVAPRTCSGPGVLHVVSAPPDYRLIETIPVGVCPTAAVLAGFPLLD